MDSLMFEHLKRGMSERDYRNKFKDFMRYNRESGNMPQDSGNSYRRNRDFFSKNNMGGMNYNRQEDNWEEESMYRRNNSSYRRNAMGNEAQSIVSSMYHMENDRKFTGEKFDMNKAKQVKEKYNELLQDVPVEEVYIAINAQYHDYAPLFRTWFREGIEHKIIESAIVFWFCDVDFDGESKVEDYFKM